MMTSNLNLFLYNEIIIYINPGFLKKKSYPSEILAVCAHDLSSLAFC